jgi:hypothetical protein
MYGKTLIEMLQEKNTDFVRFYILLRPASPPDYKTKLHDSAVCIIV